MAAESRRRPGGRLDAVAAGAAAESSLPLWRRAGGGRGRWGAGDRSGHRTASARWGGVGAVGLPRLVVARGWAGGAAGRRRGELERGARERDGLGVECEKVDDTKRNSTVLNSCLLG